MHHNGHFDDDEALKLPLDQIEDCATPGTPVSGRGQAPLAWGVIEKIENDRAPKWHQKHERESKQKLKIRKIFVRSARSSKIILIFESRALRPDPD